MAFRNWRVCLSSPLQALSRVTPSGLQSAVPRWDPPHASRADQPRPWSALGLLQQPLTMWNQPQQIKSKQETSFFSFLSMQLNTLESHANSRDGQILVFFSSFRTHHTHFLTYTTPTDTWAHQLCLLTSLFARLFGEMGGTGRGVWFSAIAALGPLTHTRRERAILLPSKGLFAKQSVLAKAMYNGSDSATPSPIAKNYFYTAWNAAVLIAIDILLNVIFYFCLFVYVQQRLTWFHTGYSLLQVNLFLFLLV